MSKYEEFIAHTRKMLVSLHEHCKVLFKVIGSQPPMLCIITRDEVKVEPMQDYIESPEIMQAVIKMHTLNNLGTILVTEAWMATCSKEDIESDKEILRPSEREDREEVVIFVVQTKVGNYAARARILREPNDLGDLEFFDVEDGTGKGDLQGRYIVNQ